jgi:hypothetical protein
MRCTPGAEFDVDDGHERHLRPSSGAHAEVVEAGQAAPLAARVAHHDLDVAIGARQALHLLAEVGLAHLA